MSKQEKSPATAQSEAAEPVNFEKAMAELEQLVTQMEEGDLSLDDSLQAFERGIKLTRQCQHALSQAELKVKTLTAANTLEELTQEDA
jgi:exodeoxyribonuclease VII small subunit